VGRWGEPHLLQSPGRRISFGTVQLCMYTVESKLVPACTGNLVCQFKYRDPQLARCKTSASFHSAFVARACCVWRRGSLSISGLTWSFFLEPCIPASHSQPQRPSSTTAILILTACRALHLHPGNFKFSPLAVVNPNEASTLPTRSPFRANKQLRASRSPS
jgi:hypothetical protein